MKSRMTLRICTLIASLLLACAVTAQEADAPKLAWRDPAPQWDFRQELHTGVLAQMGRRVDSGVRILGFSSDGNRLVTAPAQYSEGKPAPLHVWEIRTGRHLFSLHNQTGGILAAAFSPDGSRLASGGTNNKLFLWDLKTAKPVGEPQPHPGHVYSVAFSADSRWLLVASDGLHLWDVAKGAKEKVTFADAAGTRYVEVAFAPDGKKVVASKWFARSIPMGHCRNGMP